MQLKRLFGICSLALLFQSCIKPEKPVVEVCQLDAGASEGICGMSGQASNTIVARKPLIAIDKSTCFPPTEWKKYKDYVDLLAKYADYLEKHCK